MSRRNVKRCCSLAMRHVHSSEGVILLHNEAGFSGMRRAGELAARALDLIGELIRPGVKTEDLDRWCHNFILSHNAVPAPLGYQGYPKSICTSVNEVVCHGIPSPSILKNGDILNVDVTVILDGWHGDTSRMFCVGQVSAEAKKLIDVTKAALDLSIEALKPGESLRRIGTLIEKFAHQNQLSVVRDYCGHGIGKSFHTAPSVLHYGHSGPDLTLMPGMFFTIEPMLNIGKADTVLLDDGWTVRTQDRSLSAQFEHTVGITETGYEIFTVSEKTA